ncbi:MAG: glycerophosphodiester phosphodiesterase [Acidimicrobiia bacterium]|nr:glycerophosphodiester phosphodiesterase [Acidimicrobiia bacterium]
MTSRLPSLTGTIIAFGHRGAAAHAPDNTMESFRLGMTLGATGLESDVWVTADGVAVLDHDGMIGPRFRRRKIASMAADELPDEIPTLTELLDLTQTSVPVSLDIKDEEAFEAVIRTARNWGGKAEESLWLCHREPNTLAQWRPRTTAKLVNSTRLGRINEGIERRLARLHDANVEALNMFHSDWSGGTVALAHRFQILAFGWGARHERELAAVVDAGIDAVYSNHVDRMTSVINQFY